jgi:glucosamine--fructose-6-phosphate aminotransferase (isomerizing)
LSFRYDQQIASQPVAVEAVLQRAVQRLLRTGPLIFAGQGTSLHAARVAAAWAGFPAQAFEAHDLAHRLEIPANAEVVVVSHSGGGATSALLAKARAAGARTFAVCGEAARVDADEVVRTCPQETAQTHSASYTAALAALGRMLGADLAAVPSLLRDALALPAPVEEARRLLACRSLLVAGFGLDAIAAAECALKLKEAAFVWAEGLAVEQALHGPQAALQAGMGAILFPPASDDGGSTGRLRALCGRLGVAVVEVRVPPCPEQLRPFAAIVDAQRLAAEIARLNGGDPDASRNLTR